MKPFSMEPVLRYRKQVEDTVRQELFISLEQEAKIKAELLQKIKTLATLYTNLADEQRQGTTVNRLQLFTNRIDVGQNEIRDLQKKLQEQQQVVARKRRKLVQASQDKKSLEKLKEKQNLAYKQYKDKKEAAMLDEIAVLRHGR